MYTFAQLCHTHCKKQDLSAKNIHYSRHFPAHHHTQQKALHPNLCGARAFLRNNSPHIRCRAFLKTFRPATTGERRVPSLPFLLPKRGTFCPPYGPFQLLPHPGAAPHVAVSPRILPPCKLHQYRGVVAVKFSLWRAFPSLFPVPLLGTKPPMMYSTKVCVFLSGPRHVRGRAASFSPPHCTWMTTAFPAPTTDCQDGDGPSILSTRAPALKRCEGARRGTKRKLQKTAL